MTIDPLQLSKERPDLSASTPVTKQQSRVLGGTCVLLLLAVIAFPWQTGRAFILLATLFYLSVTVYKVALVWFSTVFQHDAAPEEDAIAELRDEDLPVYTILVALYKEPEVVAQLVAALDAIDYPADKKDVHLLLEADDIPSRHAAAKVKMPPGFHVTLVPESFPRTKPKACNIGLALAKGKYLALYDAEDRPEPDQLKKAILGFRKAGPSTACLQAKLNFYNPRQNLLTRWFAMEYAAWYDLTLPGLSRIGSVIPLGGTSNHFDTAKLRELMGWDAYNVTEDCDLGIRIYRAGYRSQTIDSTTWEEACSSLPFWIRQRTRWIKGYIQTYLVHMREPRKLLRELGLFNFLNFQMLLGGLVVSFLINPLFWGLAMLWVTLRMEMLTDLFPGAVFAMGGACLFAGNFAFVYVGAVACYKRGYFDLVKVALLAPVYWIMMSFSGWRAFFQFFSNPFLWEKTQHGLNKKTNT